MLKNQENKLSSGQAWCCESQASTWGRSRNNSKSVHHACLDFSLLAFLNRKGSYGLSRSRTVGPNPSASVSFWNTRTISNSLSPTLCIHLRWGKHLTEEGTGMELLVSWIVLGENCHFSQRQRWTDSTCPKDCCLPRPGILWRHWSDQRARLVIVP